MADMGQTNGSARCVLCPAACQLQVAATGPDRWRSEFPLDEGHGLCPRGSALGELLGHPRRILLPASREGGSLAAISMHDAVGGILAQSAGRGLTILVDSHIPIEQMLEIAAWCAAWPEANFCFVVEPAERMLLLGGEESAADYLRDDDFADCDGFLIIGDAFAADPICARGVFDARKAQPRMPIVTIDAAAGTPAKFATHRVDAAVGHQLASLAAVAAAAGVSVDGDLFGPLADNPSAVAAGGALAGCTRLGVIVAAEYGRGEDWRAIGHLSGRLASAKGGGLALQTVGLNALAAVRLNAMLGGVELSDAISDGGAVRFAVGCDVLGMFGWPDGVFAAAAALPNRTTAAARYVLPLSMPGEWSGTYLAAGSKLVTVEPLLAPPAGIPSPAELVGALAAHTGVTRGKLTDVSSASQRLASGAAGAQLLLNHSPSPALLLARRAIHHGCGELTAHGSWQIGAEELPALRISAKYAHKLGIANLAVVNVRIGEKLLHARARYAPELSGEYVVLPEGLPEARALTPSFIEDKTGALGAGPMVVDVSVS
ncbi:MAG: hypothetical protein ACYS8X_01240 [Planctomycetota bacterium]|jgi:anaerobic selenocysteine-containing dehydrogenase